MAKKIGKALVVGAGISGIRTALDLAETGYGVTLIDRAPHIGGVLSQLDRQFPTDACGMCKMLPLVQRDASSQVCLRKGLFHENIDLRLSTEMAAVEGEPGNFTVSLREKPTWVDPGRCIGCGVCVDVCPVEVPDDFNAGFGSRKAIYLPVPHTVPNPYVIDPAACNHCGACQTLCPVDAVRLPADRRKGFRILVVDDERVVRDSLKAWLEDEGFFVDTAESGPKALEKLAQEPFQLMLTDIKMPGMDGVTLLAKAKERFPDLAVLMMTAYATVETAVDAMKIGALDYLIKPFDPEIMIPKVVAAFSASDTGPLRDLVVGAIVLCGGTDVFDPADGKNVYGYGVNPNVVTNLELERILSGTGPTRGRLIRPHDNKPVEKIAWLQCVGSRDIQCNADFCSSICCMIAVKEALLAKARAGEGLDTAIFYMDMRTCGKSFQRYRDRAEHDHGVRFERARVHTVVPDADSGDPVVRYVATDGSVCDETFDMVVLAVGQRPAPGTEAIAEMTQIQCNRWGFVRTEPFLPANTEKPGIVTGGSFSGLKDIGESVIQASTASTEASRIIHAAGGALAAGPVSDRAGRDVSAEPAKVLVALCACGNHAASNMDRQALARELGKDPRVDQVAVLDQGCTAAGWDRLVEIARAAAPNRILLGACQPYLFTAKIKELGRQIDLDPALMDVVDILSPAMTQSPEPMADSSELAGKTLSAISPDPSATRHQLATLKMGLARLRHMDLLPVSVVPVQRRALVVGGGIAGMHAALAIADHGYPVDLVEETRKMGGNLHWLHQTLDGDPVRPFLEETLQRIEKHPNIEVHLKTTIETAFGEVGHFYTTLAGGETAGAKTLEHGAVILATGGNEAETASYGFGANDTVITQKAFESRLGADDFDAEKLNTVVMIQCVGSREEPRNYCSRVCCPTSLKHALALKEKNPDIVVYILYRDIMTPGFAESHFTRARQAGVIFIQYRPDDKPRVSFPDGPEGPISITAMEPLLGRPVEIEADLLVLATGIVPRLPAQLASAFGIERDGDGFFAEAESKWRPVDALKEGVFACGLALSPRSIPEAVASAGAAAQRTLRILSQENLSGGKIVAFVRHSLCSLCERCIEACPYGARAMVPDQGKVWVNPAMCQGCGDCATVCPNSASVVPGFTGQQMMDVIDAAIEGGWQ